MSREYQTCYVSEIGPIKITATDQAITSLYFVEDQTAGPDESLPAVLQSCVWQLDEYFRGERREFTLNLAPAGTPFQQKVWRQLQTIPFGQTTSYLAVAIAIGNKKAIRAVGRANGQNPISIIIPCHRVIGSNGQLTGYGGGLWRKAWLLNHEQSIASGRQLALF